MAGAKEIKPNSPVYKVHKKLQRQWKWWRPSKMRKTQDRMSVFVRILKQYEMLSATSLKQVLVINTHFNSTRSEKVGILVV